MGRVPTHPRNAATVKRAMAKVQSGDMSYGNALIATSTSAGSQTQDGPTYIVISRALMRKMMHATSN